jgi:hemerythrin superfamily protein
VTFDEVTDPVVSLTGAVDPASTSRAGEFMPKHTAAITFDLRRRGQGTATFPTRVEGSPMDAIVMLRNDHNEVEALFKRLEKGDLTVVPDICTALAQHAIIEEEEFYPAVRSGVDGALDDVLEAIEEHHVVKVLVAELEAIEPSDETYKAKATVLMELVRHHVEEEESEMFPEVRKALGRKRLTEIGERLEKAKAAFVA